MTPNPKITLSADPSEAAFSEQRGGMALVTSILGFSTLAAGLLFGYYGITQLHWQYFLIAGGMFATGAVSIFGFSKALKNEYTNRDLGWLSMVFVLAMFLATLFVARTGLACGIIFLIFSLTLTSITSSSSSRGSNTIILGLVFSTTLAISGTFLTAFQVNLPEVDAIIPGLLSIVLMIYIALLVVQFVSAPLQTRLTTAFLAVVIIPLSIISLIQNQSTLSRVRTENVNSLGTTAYEVALFFEKFINSNLDVIQQEAETESFANYLIAPAETSQAKEAELQMQGALRLLQIQESDERDFLSSYALLNSIGLNVYDTDKNGIGKYESTQDYFLIPIRTGQAYFSSVFFDGQGKGYVFFSAPVKDNQQHIIGVLRERYDAGVFQELAEEYSGLLGENSHVMLIDENMVRLADTYQPGLIYSSVDKLSSEQITALQSQGRLPILSSGLNTAATPELTRLLRLEDKSGNAFLDLDQTQPANTLPEMVAYTTMGEIPWKIIYLKANYDQRPAENEQSRTTILITSIVTLLVGLVSIGISRVLADPIINLTQTARKITMGDLSTQAEMTGNDEFGTLGIAFNLMTERMRTFISDLEGRVSLRTQELKQRNEILVYRSNQLRTVAEVARSIVTSQELNSLLESVANLISARFGYYHVGIFLLDEKEEYAVLRAANSEGGKRMLARQHKLRVGRTGIVGYVTGTGEPRIATNVGEDATHFNNPDLPLTRSEMALPLRVGYQVVGALDVQSTEANSFTQEDIELFSVLADQVSIAIYNNRLYNETARALAEAQTTHQRYLQQEWHSEVSTRPRRTYRYSSQGLAPAEPFETAGEGKFPIEPSSSIEIQPDGNRQMVMNVPIVERGVPIGIIRIRDEGENRTWSEDELKSVHGIALQVGAALETARLFEKTTQRADRERKVLEITGRIRSSNDPQEMLAIAAAELQKALGATRAQFTIQQPPSQSASEIPGNGRNHLDQ